MPIDLVRLLRNLPFTSKSIWVWKIHYIRVTIRTLAGRNWTWSTRVSPWWWRYLRGIHILKEWRKYLGRRKMYWSSGSSHIDPKVGIKSFDRVVTPCSALYGSSHILNLACLSFLFAPFVLQKILPTSTLLNSLVEWKGVSQEQACISALPFPQALSFLAVSWIPSWPQ